MSIDIVVMAHPTRAAQAEELAAEIDAPVVWDERNDEWDTGARAWGAINPDTTWGLVVQDDALPVPDFRRHVEAVASYAPPTAVGLYVGTGRPRAGEVMRAVAEADRVGASWLECDGLLWGVAVMLPTEHIAPMLAWAEGSRLPYDQRIGAWYATQGLPVRYCWPSLVDHADGPRLATTSGNPNTARRAHRVGAPEGWDGPVVPIRHR